MVGSGADERWRAGNGYDHVQGLGCSKFQARTRECSSTEKISRFESIQSLPCLTGKMQRHTKWHNTAVKYRIRVLQLMDYRTVYTRKRTRKDESHDVGKRRRRVSFFYGFVMHIIQQYSSIFRKGEAARNSQRGRESTDSLGGGVYSSSTGPIS